MSERQSGRGSGPGRRDPAGSAEGATRRAENDADHALRVERVQSPGARRRSVAAAVAVAGLLVVLAGTGLISRLQTPSASVPTLPAPSPSLPATEPVAFGRPQRLFVIPAPVVTMASTGTDAVVASLARPADAEPPAPPAPITCGPAALSFVGGSDGTAVTRDAPFGSVPQLVGEPGSRRLIGMGLDRNCQRPIVALSLDAGQTWLQPNVEQPRFLASGPDWLGIDPQDQRQLAVWFKRPLGAGVLMWTSDGALSWNSKPSGRPLGWDRQGHFWSIGPYGVEAAPVPGAGALEIVLAPDSSPEGLQSDSALLFGDNILVALPDGVDEAPTDGSDQLRSVLDLRQARLAAVGSTIAAVGIDASSGALTLATSADGRTFVSEALPDAVAGRLDQVVDLAVRYGAVLLATRSPQDASATAVWEIAIGGAQSADGSAGLPAILPAPSGEASSDGQAVDRTLRWSRVDRQAPPAGEPTGTSWTVLASPNGGFVGFDGLTSGFGVRVLRSTDARSWTPSGALPDSGGAMISGLAWNGRSYVAVGSQAGFPTTTTAWMGVAWVSQDLRTWRKATMRGAGGTLVSVVSGRHGFVAVGSSPTSNPPIWTSTDGLAWNQIQRGPAFVGGPLETVAVFAVGDGYLIVGRDGETPVSWLSPDGRTWSEVPLGGVTQGFMAVAAGPHGYVALGAAGLPVQVGPGDLRTPVATWTSDDGIHWVPIGESPALFNATLIDLIATPLGFVAAGARDTDPQPWHVWLSDGGRTWTRANLDLTGVALVDSITSDGRRVVLAGQDTLQTPLRPSLWIADLGRAVKR